MVSEFLALFTKWFQLWTSVLLRLLGLIDQSGLMGQLMVGPMAYGKFPSLNTLMKTNLITEFLDEGAAYRKLKLTI